MDPNDQLNLDFGDPELNDPDYEKKVGGDDGTAAPAPTDGATQGDDTVTPTDDKGAAPDAGDAGDKAAPGEQRGQDDKAGDPKHKTDDKGNLIDADGNIVAAAGAERRHFEKVQQQSRYITRLENELTEARKSDAYAKALNEVPQKLGLDMRETELGLQAIASFKKDPVATARWMLQETMRLGYNLQQIVGADAKGQINGGTMDLQAIKAMIAEQVAPLIGDRQAVQRETEIETAAQREYEAFIAKHDHADVHEDVIANMMAQDARLSPEVAYWQLREYAAKNGFDFTKPLRDQVQSRKQGGQGANGHAQPRPNAQQQQQPMPNGGAPTQDMQNGPTMAQPDEAWDSIVRQSLAEAGLLN